LILFEQLCHRLRHTDDRARYPDMSRLAVAAALLAAAWRGCAGAECGALALDAGRVVCDGGACSAKSADCQAALEEASRACGGEAAARKLADATVMVPHGDVLDALTEGSTFVAAPAQPAVEDAMAADENVQEPDHNKPLQKQLDCMILKVRESGARGSVRASRPRPTPKSKKEVAGTLAAAWVAAIGTMAFVATSVKYCHRPMSARSVLAPGVATELAARTRVPMLA